MKTPKNSLTVKLGRPSPINVLTLASVLIGTAATCHAQSFWTGGTSDFNVAGSWNPAGVPTGNAANDSGLGNVVLIQPGDPVWGHGDTLAGQGSGAAGAYLQTGSTNNTGYPSGGSWLRLGIGTGGTAGYYTLSNGVVNVAGQTHLGEHGTGTLEVDGGTYNTGYNGNPGICAGDGDFGVSTGTLILTGGTINNINNETWFGEGANCVGYFNMSGGTLNANNWFVFGRNGGTGYGVMTGGTINFTGGGQFLIGGGGTGSLAQSGGILNVQNQYLIPQSGSPGTNILSGTAVVNLHDWIAVGRNSGHGELDISGNASITRDNNNDSGANFDIGGGGPGVINQNGGAITNLAGQTWIGESSSAIWNLNSGVASMGSVLIAKNGNASGTLNLNGGQFAASGISSTSTGTSLLNFNGGTLQASAANVNFMSGLSLVLMGSGGLVFDSQGFTVTIPQEIDDNGGGNLTKIGSGTLNLTGPNTYAGNTTVSAGTLGTTTASVGGGSYSVAGGATLNVQVVGSLNSQINMPSLTFSASATTLGIDLNNFGNPSSAPINVSGALTVSGTVTINVADATPQIGQFPLISYSSKTGTGYVLGSIPVGVGATLVDDTANHSIDLNITSINLPRWNGNVNSNWDVNVTQNWINSGTGLPTTYQQGNAVTFDDNATGTTSVNLGVAVTPGSVTLNNNNLTYTLSGNGGINGSIGLLMEGTGIFTLDTTNGYTGPTVINAGTLAVNNLANGGSPSAIGASSANPTNLVISGATLSYIGSATSVNRGYSLANSNSVIDVESNLTLSGVASSIAIADFVKSGPAQLAYTTVGVNALSGSASAGYRTINGTTKFDGSAGGQTNNVLGHFGVGGLNGTNAAVVLTNSTLNVLTGGIDLGRSGGAVGTLVVGGSAVLNAGSGNFALGDGNGVISTGVVNQVGGTVNVVGPQMFVGQNVSGVGSYTLSGGTLNINNWLAIGRQGGSGVFNLSGNAALVKTGGGNLDIGTSAGIGGFSGTGVLNQTGGAITNTASQVWLGEGASGEPASGTWNMSGGTALLGEVHLGVGGTGTSTLNVSGSANITESYLLLANYDTNTTGNVNIGDPLNPGGTITVNADMNVGGQGFGTLNFVPNGGGKLTVTGTLYLSRFAQTADGIINLNTGGTLIAAYINNGWGFQNNFPTPTNNPNALNFNGGTLKAYVASTFFIQPYVNTVVQSGGAIIDDGGFAVTIQAPLVDGGGGGGLTKLGSGTLILAGTNTYTGSTLVSTGSFGCSASIASPVTIASGATLLGDAGTIGAFSINNNLTFVAGSTASFNVTPTSNDQVQGLTGVTYGGALVVTDTSATPLLVGSVIKLFNSATPGSGNFSSVTLLPVGTATFNPATGELTVTSSAPPKLNSPVLSGGNLTLIGTGGSPGAGYTLLSTTNLLSGWITNTQSTFSSTGTFTNVIPVSTSQPAQFFRIRTP